MQLFFFLKDHPKCMKQCKGSAQTLTMVCKNTPKRDTSKTLPFPPKKSTLSLPPKRNDEGGHPTPRTSLSPYLAAAAGYYPLHTVRGWGLTTGKELMFPSNKAILRKLHGTWAVLLMTQTGTFKSLVLFSKLLNWLAKMSYYS
jgi:hypothetical protein